MGSKRWKVDPDEQIHQRKKSKEPIWSEEGDLQRPNETIQSQTLSDQVKDQQKHNEDQATSKIAERHLRKRAQATEVAAHTVFKEKLLVKVNKKLKAMIVASKKMLDKNMAEN